MSTHRQACTPQLWGPQLLPKVNMVGLLSVWLIVCKDMYLCCYEEALQESWQWIDCVPAGGDLHQSWRISPTENCSLPSGFFACSSRTK